MSNVEKLKATTLTTQSPTDDLFKVAISLYLLRNKLQNTV